MPSTADRPDDLHRALEFVVDLVGPGFTVERFESGGKPSALLYLGAKRPRFQVILNAHLDVVPALPDQFRPRREGERLYARGAQDMKVAALVEARVFRELAHDLPYPLALQLVTDEEVGGRNGTLHQIEQGVSGEFVVIGEYSGLRIVTDSKGMITATLRAVGRGGHSAYPWLGDNALIKLHRSLATVLAAYPVPAEEAWRTTVTYRAHRNPQPGPQPDPGPGGGLAGYPLPARGRRPERQDRPGNHRVPSVLLRTRCHPGCPPRRPTASRRPESARDTRAAAGRGRPGVPRRLPAQARRRRRALLLPARDRRRHLRHRRRRPARARRVRRPDHRHPVLPGAQGLPRQPCW